LRLTDEKQHRVDHLASEEILKMPPQE
jgi:hypothetical protein